MSEIRLVENVKENVAKVIVGKEEQTEALLLALVCGGHVLIEDVPGLGKTTLVTALARSLSCSYSRIQFTPDLLPSDVTGYTAFDPGTGERQICFGGLMAQVVLADEINRTSPKTQSALLEAMEEHQVTVDGVTHALPTPFIVLATQNPDAFTGTYPLPEAQLDRFFLRISIGYPTQEQEMEVLNRYTGQVKPLETLQPVCTAQDVVAMQEAVGGIFCAPQVRSYVAAIAAATRATPSLQLGLSTRAAIALLRGGQACALLDGREYVVPEDIQHMALPVCCHRLVVNPEARMKGATAEAVMQSVMNKVAVPVRM